MTGFIFSPTPENQTLRRFGHDLLPSTFGETLRATFDDPQLRPTELLETQAAVNLEAADETPADERRRLLLEAQRRVQGDAPEVTLFQRERSRLLSVEEAKERFPSLEFKEPVRERVAQILAKQKREEAIRKDIIDRGPRGIGTLAAQLGVSLVATATDPVNVASAFVPVVSQARFAGLVARTGLTRARLSKGIIEGAVGNALLEPVVGGLSRAQQLDYEMSDALINIALGGLLGGGLHVTGGKISDFVSSRSPAEREAALRTSVAQAAQGKRVNIDPIVREDFSVLDPDRVFREGAPAARPFDLGELKGKGTAARFSDFTPLSQQDRRFLEGFVQELRETDRGELIFREVEGRGGTPDITGRRADTPEEFQQFNREAREAQREAKRIREANKRLPDDQKQPVPKAPAILTRAKVERVAEKMISRQPLGRAEGEIAEFLAGVARDRRESNVRDILSARSARNLEDERSIQAIAEREAALDNDATADFRASQRIQKSIDSFPGDIDDNAAQTEILFEREQIDALRASGVLSEAMEKQLDELEELVTQAESFGRAARAAALCMGRQ